MQRITVSVTPEVYEKLRRQAKQLRRSVSGQAGFLLEAQVQAQVPQPEPDPPRGLETDRCDQPAPVTVP